MLNSGLRFFSRPASEGPVAGFEVHKGVGFVRSAYLGFAGVFNIYFVKSVGRYSWPCFPCGNDGESRRSAAEAAGATHRLPVLLRRHLQETQTSIG